MIKKIFFSIIKFFLIYTSIVIFLILFFRFIDPPVTAFMHFESRFLEDLFSYNDITYKPVSIKKVSKYVPLAAIASEDQLFFEHFGFDFEQIEKAIKENQRRKRIRGASTISMQVAKNMFLFNSKIIIRKGFEAYYTLLLELLWDKKRILETYLNISEMGKNIYGIEGAAKTYYKISSSKLNENQAASIIACLPNPKKRDPRRATSYLANRRNHIIEQMNLIGGVRILKDKINY
ncbi:MAG: monofunctional biosynthetic peptidoglycan transglycosylase [Melioribacteraceae bacterium]|nr:monofunctional biosynthetic peptidoglycan transglycosylase [Melioribacteraceae bacterium]